MQYGGSVEFVHLAKLLLRSRGSLEQALALTNARTPSRVTEVLQKAAVAGGNLADSAWAGALAPYNTISNGCVESLTQHSAFDRIAPDTVIVPPRTNVAWAPLRRKMTWVTSGAVGYNPAAPGGPKPLTKLALSADGVDVQTASVLVVVTEELLKGPGVETFLGRELKAGIAAPTDAILVAALTDALTPISGSFATSAGVMTALAAGLAAMSIGASSKVYLLVDPATAQALALMTTSGLVAFPDMTIAGGSIGGIPVVVSPGVVEDTAILVDATGVATATDGPVVLDSSAYTTLQMDEAPTQNSVTPTATNVVALFQTDSVALRAERRVGALRFRDDAAALLETA